MSDLVLILTRRTLRPSKSTFPPRRAASTASSYLIPVGLPSCVMSGSLPIGPARRYEHSSPASPGPMGAGLCAIHPSVFVLLSVEHGGAVRYYGGPSNSTKTLTRTLAGFFPNLL